MTINLDQYTNTLSVTDTATNADLNVTTKGTGSHKFNTGNGEQVRIVNSTTSDYWVMQGSPTILYPDGTSANRNAALSSKGTSAVQLYTNGGNQLQVNVAHTASAVNYLQVQGNSTTNSPIVSVQGSDTNIGLVVSSKGTARIGFFTNNVSTQQFVINHTGSAVNYLQVVGGATGSAPVLSAIGSDTNIDLTLTPKGTGNVRFGTHTASADTAVSGYIEIKDSGGTIRKLAVIT